MVQFLVGFGLFEPSLSSNDQHNMSNSKNMLVVISSLKCQNLGHLLDDFFLQSMLVWSIE